MKLSNSRVIWRFELLGRYVRERRSQLGDWREPMGTDVLRDLLSRGKVRKGIGVADMPEGAVLRHFAIFPDRVQVFAEFDSGAAMVRRTFELLTTGSRFDSTDRIYRGTMIDDELVFHIYEVDGE